MCQSCIYLIQIPHRNEKVNHSQYMHVWAHSLQNTHSDPKRPQNNETLQEFHRHDEVPATPQCTCGSNVSYLELNISVDAELTHAA